MNENVISMAYQHAQSEMRSHSTWCEYDPQTSEGAHIFDDGTVRFIIAVYTLDGAPDDPFLVSAVAQYGYVQGIITERLRTLYAQARATVGSGP